MPFWGHCAGTMKIRIFFRGAAKKDLCQPCIISGVRMDVVESICTTRCLRAPTEDTIADLDGCIIRTEEWLSLVLI
jgi:hypothetical protein